MNARPRNVLPTAIAMLLTGCTSLSPAEPDLLYIGPEPVRVEREYLHRYACAAAVPLSCTCTSLMFGTCDCRC